MHYWMRNNLYTQNLITTCNNCYAYFSLQRLCEFKVNVREFTDANDDANKFKNRIANALPCEFSVMIKCHPPPPTNTVIDNLIDPADNYNRAHLKMSPGIGGSDYINASFIDVSGYLALSTCQELH